LATATPLKKLWKCCKNGSAELSSLSNAEIVEVVVGVFGCPFSFPFRCRVVTGLPGAPTALFHRSMRLDSQRVCVVRHREYQTDPRVTRDVEALVASGKRVDVICLRRAGEPQVEEAGEVTIYRLGGSQKRGSLTRYVVKYLAFWIRVFWRLSGLFWKRRHGVIQFHSMPDFLVFAGIIPKLCGAKIILDMQEATPEFFQSKYRVNASSFPVRCCKWVERRSAAFADQLLTVHTILRGVFVQRGIPERKFTCVPNVPDETIFRARPDFRPASRRTDSFILISHGSILERYGLHIAVQAVGFLREEIPGIRLRIAGAGEYLPVVKQFVQDLDLGEHVEFYGFLPARKLPELIGSSHIGLVPLLDDVYTNLMHANKMFEYIAMRRPVIISHLAAVKAYFDEHCLLFCAPGNPEDLARCVLELYRDPDRARAFADRAYERYEALRWSRVKGQYVKVIDDLLLEAR
jgi:glycosyltransferase involved in cell wall biosynthesis